MDIENAELRRDNAVMAAKLADLKSLVDDLQKQVRMKDKLIADLIQEINNSRADMESIRTLDRP